MTRLLGACADRYLYVKQTNKQTFGFAYQKQFMDLIARVRHGRPQPATAVMALVS